MTQLGHELLRHMLSAGRRSCIYLFVIDTPNGIFSIIVTPSVVGGVWINRDRSPYRILGIGTRLNARWGVYQYQRHGNDREAKFEGVSAPSDAGYPAVSPA